MELPLGSRQQRLTLLLLLLNEGRPLHADAIMDVLWGDSAPRAASGTIRTYIYRLRHLFARHNEAELISSTSGGYALRLDPRRVDAGRFVLGVDAADSARSRGDLPAAADHLRGALALWRGVPMADLHSDLVDRQRVRLEQRRVAALEELFGVQIELGRHREVLEELTAAVTAEPMRERLRELLMLALYRSGRQAEALLAYEEFRRSLGEELGADPGPDLRSLHHRILQADPALRRGRSDPPPLGAARPKPEQLPASLPVFVGRRRELDALEAVSAPVVAIRGMAGIGKTALALRWAHDIADRFPDGQLYMDLAAFDPTGVSVEPGQALRSFLHALGVPAHHVPEGLQAQTGLFRSLLAGRRMLIVLDDVRDAEHVRPLLPGHPECLAIITSRNELSGLIASEGAHPISVGPMGSGDAEALLAARVGVARVAAEPAAVQEITTECAGLPLALAAVAARVAGRPGFSLTAIAAEIRSAHGTLDYFTGTDDDATDLRVAFSCSFQPLSPEARRLFQILAVHPGDEVDVAGVAAITGLPRYAAQARLTELTSAHLLIEHTPQRYTLHHLLRSYVRERSDQRRPCSLPGDVCVTSP
ncbi:AfsR/SARP family transcriptional regulator [Sphaerisporangium rhizosphaerae]|uniref:BTAD domain-containing putative transcriptional regulator n=1 Tax=Sphaerisporangium rhizosphaerae TaxID=2269375 RepID=A0ABW2NX26_9ACTN